MVDRSKPMLKRFPSTLIQSYAILTPDKLRELANTLEERKIVHLECSVGGYDSYFICDELRMETEEEAMIRYNNENKCIEEAKKHRKKELEQLAKEFGYELKKSN